MPSVNRPAEREVGHAEVQAKPIATGSRKAADSGTQAPETGGLPEPGAGVGGLGQFPEALQGLSHESPHLISATKKSHTVTYQNMQSSIQAQAKNRTTTKQIPANTQEKGDEGLERQESKAPAKGSPWHARPQQCCCLQCGPPQWGIRLGHSPQGRQ